MGVRASSFQEEPLGLQCSTKIWAIYVVADVSINLAACPSQSGSLAMTSITVAAVICDADDPCSVNTAEAPESSFTMSSSKYDSIFVLTEFSSLEALE